jgi:hypothetical protein
MSPRNRKYYKSANESLRSYVTLYKNVVLDVDEMLDHAGIPREAGLLYFDTRSRVRMLIERERLLMALAYHETKIMGPQRKKGLPDEDSSDENPV